MVTLFAIDPLPQITNNNCLYSTCLSNLRSWLFFLETCYYVWLAIFHFSWLESRPKCEITEEDGTLKEIIFPLYQIYHYHRRRHCVYYCSDRCICKWLIPKRKEKHILLPVMVIVINIRRGMKKEGGEVDQEVEV